VIIQGHNNTSSTVEQYACNGGMVQKQVRFAMVYRALALSMAKVQIATTAIVLWPQLSAWSLELF
jgi:hypothetical protein